MLAVCNHLRQTSPAHWQSGEADGSVFQYTVQVVRMLQLRPSSQPLARMDFSTN